MEREKAAKRKRLLDEAIAKAEAESKRKGLTLPSWFR